jgi:glycyl-tRNA synthetase
MHFSPVLAPVKAGGLPAAQERPRREGQRDLQGSQSYDFETEYDEAGSIGKRYRRQDEIGTPYCITVDDQTLADGTVTIRDRDTMEQKDERRGSRSQKI